MRQMLLALALFMLPMLTVGSEPQERADAGDGTVYICMGNGAYAYHRSRSCHGLNRCTGGIRCVTISEAVSLGRSKPCGICCR